jgi:hypothetical protein
VRRIVLACFVLLAAAAIPIRAQTATSEPIGGQFNEIATVPAGTVYSPDGVNCFTATAATVVNTMSQPTLFVLRTTLLQVIPITYELAPAYEVFGYSFYFSYTDYVPVPPAPDGTPYTDWLGNSWIS